MRTMKHLALAAMAAAALALAGCGGGGSTPPAVVMPPPPTAYETAKMAIMTAETAEAAQAIVDGAADDVSGTELISLQAAADARKNALATMARADAQMTALMDAAGMIDTSDLSTQDLVDAARTAIAGLRQAIADAADVDDVSMYQSQLDAAVMAVDEAQGGIDTDTRRMNQMAALSDASDDLQVALTALSGSTPTQAQLDTANNALAALNDAITAGADLTDTEKAPYQHEADNAAAPISQAQAAFDDAEDEADEERRMAMAKTGKELFAALAGNDTAGTTALDNIDLTTAPDTDLSDGLAIDATAGAGALATGTDPGSVTLRAGDSAGSLGSWMGTNYAHTNAETKVVNAAVVYDNKGPGRTQSFADRGNVLQTANAGDAPGFTAIKGYLTLAADGTIDSGANIARVMADDFTHPGTQTHTVNSDTGIFTTRGTYDGAPGVYRCTGACSSTNDGKGSPSALGGTWHFKPDAGASAMAHSPDTAYLYYGWWVSKNKDGMPTAASVFTGEVGDVEGGGTFVDPTTIAGSATYTGNAVGKFALDYSQNKAANGTSDGGHFTADVELNAKFGAIASPNNGGVSGMIDNFRLNDGSEDPGWSVMLHRAPWGSNGAFATPTTDVTETMADETKGTTWTIDGTSAARSGTWSGQTYDEALAPASVSDGSNVPTTATGTFYSEFSDVGRMVGAFGAQ